MAVSWGSGSGSSNPHYVGINASVSGTTITWEVWTKAKYPVSDNQKLTIWGAKSKTVNFRQEGPASKRRTRFTTSGSRGSSYTLSAKTTGIYNGGNPSQSRTVTIPALKPSKPSLPYATSTTKSKIAMRLGSAPSSNGAAINAYRWHVYGGPSSGTLTSGGRTWTATGLTGNKTYKIRVRARNSKGWGSWSSYKSVKTDPLPPSRPSTPTISSIQPTSFKVSWPYPSTHGASVSGYTLLVSTSSSFASSSTSTYSLSGRSKTVTGRTANKRYYVKVRANSVAGRSPYSSYRSAVTGADLPSTPKNLSTTRNSDSAITTSWTKVVSASRPVDNFRVRRRDNVNTSWVVVASKLSASTSTFRDTSVKADRAYEYKVAAINVSGYSPYVYGSVVKTTPDAPTGVSVTRSGDAGVLDWTHGASYPTPVEIRREVNGSWSSVVHTVGAGGSSDWTDTGVIRAEEVKYALRSVAGGLRSGWVYTRTLDGSAPPLKPSNIKPGSVRATDESFWLSWAHNPVDGSDQEEADVQWRESPTGSWSSLLSVTGDSEGATVPAQDAYMPNFQVRVRTKGGHATKSPWSDPQTIPLGYHPEVTITSPDPQVDWGRAFVTVDWAVILPGSQDDQGQWDAELLADGSVVEQRSGSSQTTREHTFVRRVDMDAAWSVRVRVTSLLGLRSDWETVSVSVRFPKPPPPIVTAEWDEVAGVASVQVTNPPDPPPESATLMNWAVSAGCRGSVLPWTVENSNSNAAISVVAGSGPGPERSDGGPALGSVSVVTPGRPGMFMYPDVAGDPSVEVGGPEFRFGALVRVDGSAYDDSAEGEYVRIGFQATSSGSPVTVMSDWQELLPGDWVWLSSPELVRASVSAVVPVVEVEGDPSDMNDEREVDVTAGLFTDSFDRDVEFDDWFDGLTPDADRADLDRTVTWVPSSHEASKNVRTLNPVTRPDPDENVVMRSIEGGPWIELADEIPVDSSFLDKTAPAAGDVQYQAIAVTSLPSTESSDPFALRIPLLGHVDHSECGLWVSAPESTGSVARAFFEYQFSGSTAAVNRKLERFDGREFPLEFSSPGMDRRYEMTWLIPPEWESNDESASLWDWDSLTTDRGPHLFRDCMGRRVYVSLGQFSFIRREDGWWTCSMNLTEVERV